MSLRALLNDEPQDPLSSFPPRSSTATTAPQTPNRSQISNPVPVSPAPTTPIPFPSLSHQHSPIPSNAETGYHHSPSSYAHPPHTNGSHRHTVHGSPSKKSRRNDNLPTGGIPYPNGHAHMEVEMEPSRAPGDTKTGSTGRSNLVCAASHLSSPFLC